MPTYGIDYAGGRPGGAAIKQAGYDFCVRYLTSGGPGLPGKLLTTAEYADLQAHGIAVAVNFETTADRMLDGYNAGVTDARLADQTLRAVGHPPDSPIYFSADWDAAPSDQVAIDAYLRGCASVIGIDRVGIYGGYWVVKRCLDNGTARWAWQAQAWSGNNRDPRAHIFQHAQYVTVGGVQCDLNEALQPDFGQHPSPAGDEMSPEIEQMIRDIHHESTLRLPQRRDDDTSLNLPDDTVLGHAADAAAFGWRSEQRLLVLQATVAALQAAITTLTAAVTSSHGLDPDEFKVILDDALAQALIKVDISVAGQPKT
jgi:hypothetical protein